MPPAPPEVWTNCETCKAEVRPALAADFACLCDYADCPYKVARKVEPHGVGPVKVAASALPTPPKPETKRVDLFAHTTA